METLKRAIGANAYKAICKDPCAFVRAFDRDPWPFQEQILKEVLQKDGQGRFRHRVAVVSLPRQNGKSTLSAWAALWRLFCDPELQQIVSVALDRASASIILDDAKRIIRNSPIFQSLLADYGLTKSEIRLVDGRQWLIKPSDSIYSRGLRPSMVCYDELGWSSDEGELFNVLSAAQAAQNNPLILVTSTVGPIQAGPLWELFQGAEANDPDVLLIHHTKNLSPLITQEFLEGQRRKLPAHVYAREHTNLWGEGSSAFCTELDWKRATDKGDPRRDTDPGPCFAFLDLGWVHDEAVFSVSKKQGGLIEILGLDVFQGSQSNPVQISSVRNRIKELSRTLNIQRVEIEAPQGVGLSQDLQLTNINAKIIYPTAKSNRDHWGALYTVLKNGTIRLPNDPKLRRQLLTLTIKESPSGWKIVDIPSIHNDRARAVAGAVSMTRSRPRAKVIAIDMSQVFSGRI